MNESIIQVQDKENHEWEQDFPDKWVVLTTMSGSRLLGRFHMMVSRNSVPKMSFDEGFLLCLAQNAWFILDIAFYFKDDPVVVSQQGGAGVVRQPIILPPTLVTTPIPVYAQPKEAYKLKDMSPEDQREFKGMIKQVMDVMAKIRLQKNHNIIIR